VQQSAINRTTAASSIDRGLDSPGIMGHRPHQASNQLPFNSATPIVSNLLQTAET